MEAKAVVYIIVIAFCADRCPGEPPRVSLAFLLPSPARSEDTVGKGRATIPFREIRSWFRCVRDSLMAYFDTAANIFKPFLKLCLSNT